jgi:hypothetical protein
MPLLNIALIVVLFEATILLGSFPTMIENARKGGRDSCLFDFRRFVDEKNLNTLADFVEGYYCYNRVHILKMIRGLLAILVLTAAIFVVSGYYSSNTIIPNAKRAAETVCPATNSLDTIEAALLRMPEIHYQFALGLELLVFICFIGVIIQTGFPNDILKIINPQKIEEQNDSNE